MVREAPRMDSRSRRITALCPLQVSPSHPLRASITVRGSLVRLHPYPQQTCHLG